MKAQRPHMSIAVKLNAALYALGLDPSRVEFDHTPALSLRPFDASTGKWTPDANDWRYIVPRGPEAHLEKTKRDIPAAAKVRRITTRHEEFKARCLAKTGQADKPRDIRKRRIPSRGFSRRTP